MTEIESRWYWDRRTNKAYYPIVTEQDTTTFVTTWHREEVEDALQSDVFVPVDEIGHERTETTFDLIDSFRLRTEPGGTPAGQ